MAQLVGYARVSTLDQNTTMQLDALKAAGCKRLFEETATGARVGHKRPELDAALQYLREGDTLVVWRLDRLARSLSQLVETVTMLRDRGIELRSLHENIDTSTSTGRLTFHLFASLAEFERDLIRDRTKAGLEAARARGRTGGRPKRLSPAEVDTARALLESDPPVSFSEVARRLKVRPSTLYNYFPAHTLGARRKKLAEEPELPMAPPA
ncbi:recombinase family protein [Methylobacterium radiotolerans]|uniref:recombinase family protein n=1 Tax=Methylobacterium radiotolerans TaxID=31998 RepID=UPI0009759F1D|nr:recombinase family protein [Methylobacterium radiotolerans]ONF49422.1 recombinase [Methylobacterium radiotolerans]